MPGLLNSSTSSISIDFTDITATHTVTITGIQFLPAAEGGRKLKGTVLIDNGLGTPISALMTITIRDLVYDEFGMYGETLDAKARKHLVTKF